MYHVLQRHWKLISVGCAALIAVSICLYVRASITPLLELDEYLQQVEPRIAKRLFTVAKPHLAAHEQHGFAAQLDHQDPKEFIGNLAGVFYWSLDAKARDEAGGDSKKYRARVKELEEPFQNLLQVLKVHSRLLHARAGWKTGTFPSLRQEMEVLLAKEGI